MEIWYVLIFLFSFQDKTVFFSEKKLLFLSEKIKVCAKEVCREMNVRVTRQR